MTVDETADRALNVLTAAEQSTYWRDGYVVVDEVLTVAELKEVNDVVDELIERRGGDRLRRALRPRA